ncbi:MAG TPA: hypothetical protein VFP68_10850 [Burkholderiaceae bacterium]|nr:hypothetical protein [Burkholderiaceae bacterium]
MSALAGVAVVLLAIELLCRVLPVSTSTRTGYYVDPLIMSYPAGHSWTVSTGWDLRNPHRLHANNAGFSAARDFVADPLAVALIGDSFVEASMLDPSDRPEAQLERHLGGRPVYAMGFPGTSLLDYAERIRLAHERWGVRDFVVLMERGDVKQSLCGSGNIAAMCLDPVTLTHRVEKAAEPGWMKQAMRESAVAQYLVGQLKVSPRRVWQQAIAQARPAAKPGAGVAAQGATGGGETSGDMKVVDEVASTFFDRVEGHVLGRLVLVLDADRRPISTSGREVSDPARRRFIEIARARGALVVDGEPIFRAHAQRSRWSLDVGPYDAHLNPIGLRLLMSAAAAQLAPRFEGAVAHPEPAGEGMVESRPPYSGRGRGRARKLSFCSNLTTLRGQQGQRIRTLLMQSAWSRPLRCFSATASHCSGCANQVFSDGRSGPWRCVSSSA